MVINTYIKVAKVILFIFISVISLLFFYLYVSYHLDAL